MSNVLCPLSACTQYFSGNGSPLSGGTISFYGAGSSTPQTVYSTPTGGAPATVITLDASGRLQQEIWQPSGVAIKAIIADSSGNAQGIALDNISGVNDTSLFSLTEWIASGFAPVYSSASQFSTAADSITTFQVGRRIQATVSAGTVYGTVTSSSYNGSATTINVQMDSGMALDSGLSAVNVGFLGGTHPSTPSPIPYLTLQAVNFPAGVVSNAALSGPRVKVTTFTSSGTFTPSANVSLTKITCVGGGGAGGGTLATSSGQYAAGGGGGSGTAIVGWFTPAQIGASQTVTVGAGGAGVTGGSGGAGGFTTCGSLVTGLNGQGGVFGTNTSGTWISQGGYPDGKLGVAIVPSAIAFAGFGGGGTLGYGSGGQGTSRQGVNGATAGSNGSPGVCIIEEYF